MSKFTLGMKTGSRSLVLISTFYIIHLLTNKSEIRQKLHSQKILPVNLAFLKLFLLCFSPSIFINAPAK
jgi:hypothetical protein